MSGFKGYLVALVAVVLFPLAWLRSVRIARRHTDADPKGVLKVAAAIVAGVGIALLGTIVLLGFQANAVEGMYDSMDGRVALAVGESAYNDNQAIVDSANNAIPIIQGNLANATDPAKRSELQTALNDTIKQRNEAAVKVANLVPNHELYLRLQPLMEDQDDDALRAEVAETGLAEPAGMDDGVESAIAMKDEAIDDMHLSLWLFAWPSLAGAFFAPLAFALGSILKRAFVESDTVGFKPYPGAAAGLFLLMGAFGLPSVLFAAWVFNDAFGRSEEGQISL